MTAPRPPGFLLAVLAATLLVKLHLAAVTSDIPLVWDEGKYYEAARQLAAAGLDLRAFPGTFLTPGYPCFLAAVMLLAGPHVLWLKLAQALVSTATAWLLWIVLRRRTGPAAAARAAALFALLPELVGFSHLLWSETLLLAILVPALGAILRTHESGSPLAAAGAGALWGLATLVKPAYVYYPLVVALLLVLRPPPATSRRRAAALGLLLLAVFGATLLPWMLRNRALSGRLSLTTNAWINVWVGNKERATPAHRLYRALDREEDREALARREALAWIRGQGLLWLPVKIHRNLPALFGASSFSVRHLWLGAYGDVGIGTARGVVAVTVALYLAAMLLGIAGFAAAPWDALKWHAALFVGIATTFHVAMESLTRYREPFMIFVAAYAGLAAAPGAPGLRAALARPAARLLLAVLLAVLLYAVVFSPDNAGSADVWRGRTVRDRMAPAGDAPASFPPQAGGEAR